MVERTKSGCGGFRGKSFSIKMAHRFISGCPWVEKQYRLYCNMWTYIILFIVGLNLRVSNTNNG
jgi:TM2 domain-containing membrane protein YozV